MTFCYSASIIMDKSRLVCLLSNNEKGLNKMEKIASFTIDHIKLKPGVYVSRKDHVGAETITTFDLRMTSPNDEPVMNTAEVHTIEHLGATFSRNHRYSVTKPFTSDPWAAAPAFISCWQETTNPKIS